MASPATSVYRGPEISIVLPFRNAETTLHACLESISQQSFTNFEVVGIDDGSDDGSAALVQARLRKDNRFRVLSPGRIGLVKALNAGTAASTGAFVARMDADDLMHPERLRMQRDWLLRHEDVALVASRVALFPTDQIKAGYAEYVRWQNECISSDQIAENLYVESPFAHPSVMMRREVLERLHGYTEGDFPEDYELWFRMHAAGYRMAKVPEVLLKWRDGTQRASRTDSRYARTAFDRLRARFLSQDPRLHTGRDIVVWSGGRPTRLRVRHLIDSGIRPAAWIDIHPGRIGRHIWGIPVHPPAWLAVENRPFVLIYVTNHGAREEIESFLKENNYEAGKNYLAVG